MILTLLIIKAGPFLEEYKNLQESDPYYYRKYPNPVEAIYDRYIKALCNADIDIKSIFEPIFKHENVNSLHILAKHNNVERVIELTELGVKANCSIFRVMHNMNDKMREIMLNNYDITNALKHPVQHEIILRKIIENSVPKYYDDLRPGINYSLGPNEYSLIKLLKKKYVIDIDDVINRIETSNDKSKPKVLPLSSRVNHDTELNKRVPTYEEIRATLLKIARNQINKEEKEKESSN